MAIKVACPACGTITRVSDDQAGKTLNCPDCETALSIPSERPSGNDARIRRFGKRVGMRHREQAAAKDPRAKSLRRYLIIGGSIAALLAVTAVTLTLAKRGRRPVDEPDGQPAVASDRFEPDPKSAHGPQSSPQMPVSTAAANRPTPSRPEQAKTVAMGDGDRAADSTKRRTTDGDALEGGDSAIERIRSLTEEERAKRAALLSQVYSRELAKVIELQTKISDLEIEVERANRAVKNYERTAPRGNLLAVKRKTVADKTRDLNSARKDLAEHKVFFADERGRIKAEYPIEGDLYEEFEGRFLAVEEVRRIKEERRKAERRLAEVEASPNGTAQKAAELYAKELIEKGTIQAAQAVRIKRGVVEVFASYPTVSIPKDIKKGQFTSNVSGYGVLQTVLVYFQVRYVSTGGVVNEREVYVPVVQLNSGIWVYIYDDGGALLADDNGRPERNSQGGFVKAGFSMPKGSF